MSLKTDALEHWNQNKEWLKKLNWSDWKHKPISYRLTQAPIFGSDCPYCHEYNDNCNICPLHKESIYHCCREWEAVYIALVRRPTTKFSALIAVNKLIAHIKEAGDV